MSTPREHILVNNHVAVKRRKCTGSFTDCMEKKECYHSSQSAVSQNTLESRHVFWSKVLLSLENARHSG